MEFILPALALGGLYKVAQQQKKQESFDSANTNNRRIRAELLPNMDIPNRNFPEEYPVQNPSKDLTSQLSTLNMIDTPAVYTDKYFQPNMYEAPASSMGGTDTSPMYHSLTGESVGADYFKHNNMVPFYKTKSHANNAPNATESTLDNYMGSGSQYQVKTEQAPLFAPDTNFQWAHGMPSTTDFIKSRMNPSMNMSNVRPFEPIQVGPGLGLGYTSEGALGFNSGMLARDQWRDKNVDELRVANKQKASGLGMLGYEGPAMSHNPRSLEAKDIGQWEQRGPDRTFDMGPERYFTTMGVATAPTARSIPMPKQVHRPETSTEYTGVAGGGQTAHVVRGEYMPSHQQTLDSFPLAPAYAVGAGGANSADFGAQSVKAYPNNRSVRTSPDSDGYYGAVKSGIGAAVAPFVDMLRPSRKENTVGNLRPYQNAKSSVEAPYVYNPSDRAPVTIRQTTENSKFHLQVNANQCGGAYQSTPHQPVVNERDTTTDYYYSGGATSNSKGTRTYDAEYNQRNNDIKASTIHGRTNHGGMGLLNSQVNMNQRTQETMLRNDRPVDSRVYTAPPSIDTMGAVQGHGHAQLYQGQQLDRNSGDILTQLKGNPYTLSVTNGL